MVNNYVRKKDLQTEIMTLIEDSNTPEYIILEVLKEIRLEILSKILLSLSD